MRLKAFFAAWPSFLSGFRSRSMVRPSPLLKLPPEPGNLMRPLRIFSGERLLRPEKRSAEAWVIRLLLLRRMPTRARVTSKPRYFMIFKFIFRVGLLMLEVMMMFSCLSLNYFCDVSRAAAKSQQTVRKTLLFAWS